MDRLFNRKKSVRLTPDDDLDELTTLIKRNQKDIYKILKKDKVDELKELDRLIQLNQNVHIIKKNETLECPICMDNRINVCVVPCGHCFCNNCLTNASKCYLCQREIFLKQTLYL